MPACHGIARSSAAMASSPQCYCYGAHHISRKACCGHWPICRRPILTPRRMPSRARYCTNDAAARWRRSARCRSAVIMDRSIPRHCSSCLPRNIISAPAISTRSGTSGPTSSPRSLGSTIMATWMATASSNIRARPTRACPTRAGRTAATASSIATGGWHRRRSPCARCKPMYSPPSKGLQRSPRVLATAICRQNWQARPRTSGSGSRMRSGSKTRGPMPSHSMATSSAAKSWHPMPATACLRGSYRPIGPNAWPSC